MDRLLEASNEKYHPVDLRAKIPVLLSWAALRTANVEAWNGRAPRVKGEAVRNERQDIAQQVDPRIIPGATVVMVYREAPLVTVETVPTVPRHQMIGKGGLVRFPVGPPIQGLAVALRITEEAEADTTDARKPTNQIDTIATIVF